MGKNHLGGGGSGHLGDPFGLDSKIKTVVKTVTNLEQDTIEGHTVHYWHAALKQMEKDTVALLDTQDKHLRIIMERKGTDTGLRAVIRHALNELRRLDPNNQMLDKKVRDRIFHEFEKEEMDKLLKARNLEPWNPPELSQESHLSE